MVATLLKEKISRTESFQTKEFLTARTDFSLFVFEIWSPCTSATVHTPISFDKRLHRDPFIAAEQSAEIDLTRSH